MRFLKQNKQDKKQAKKEAGWTVEAEFNLNIPQVSLEGGQQP